MGKVEQHNRKHQRSVNWWCLLPFLVLGVVFWSSDSAEKELQAEQQHYCEMVEEGSWPDYKGIYDEFCK